MKAGGMVAASGRPGIMEGVLEGRSLGSRTLRHSDRADPCGCIRFDRQVKSSFFFCVKV